MCVLVTQSRLILCDPMDYSPPGSSVHGILQARILEWVAMLSSGDLPDPWIEPLSHVPCTGRWVLYHYAIWGAYTSAKFILLK